MKSFSSRLRARIVRSFRGSAAASLVCLLQLLSTGFVAAQSEEQQKAEAMAAAASQPVALPALAPQALGDTAGPISLPYEARFGGQRLTVIGSDLLVRVVVDPTVTEGILTIKDPGVVIEEGEFSFDAASGVLKRTVATVTASPGADGVDDLSQEGTNAAPAADPFLVELQATVPAGAAVALQLQYAEVDIVAGGDGDAGSSQARATVTGSINAGRLGVRAPITVSVTLVDGEVDISGQSTAPAGPLRLNLRASVAVLNEFSGSSRISSTDSTVTMTAVTGVLDLVQQGGQVSVLDSTATVNGRANGGSLDIERVNGPGMKLDLIGAELSVDRSSLSQWTLTGREADARLSQTSGQGTFTWTAGSFDLNAHSGAVTATVNPSAVFSASDLRERLALTVNEGTASVANASDVSATVRGGSFSVDGCDSLAVDALDSEVSLVGFTKQGRWRIVNTSLEANFASAGRRSSLTLDGQSEGVVLLPAPCFVRFSGRSNLINSSYKINGCEVMTSDPNQRRRLRGGGLNGLDGSGGTVLQLDLAGEASVEIGES